MSHFTVLVIGNDPEVQLAPYQENNMGDCPEEYLEFHDSEKEYKEDYETGSTERVILEDGTFVSPYDDRFKVLDKESKSSFESYKYVIPEHLEKREVPFKEIYKDFDEYMKDWHGFEEKDEKMGKYGYWENPNRKWDWYQLGGRWNGFLKLKSPNMEGKVGNPSLIYPKIVEEGYADQCLKGQVDFEGMMNDTGKEAKERWEKVERIFGGEIPKLEICWKTDMWDGGKYESLEYEQKREMYHNQPALKKLEKIRHEVWDDKSNPDRDTIIWLDLSDYQCTKEEYIENARNNSFVTFAVVKDGKWYERGEMGWWACVSNEKDKKEWNNQFCSMVLDLPDDTLLSVYDCHI